MQDTTLPTADTAAGTADTDAVVGDTGAVVGDAATGAVDTGAAAGRPVGVPGVLDPERGDVPGWVLVTLMTAGLVVALWALAGPLLQQAFTDAVNSVVGGP